jgi:hydrogenase nickel incorporation protein HypA/HybF
VHELSIVRELIRLAVDNAPVGGRVLEVHARVGRLTSVSPDAMQFYFEALRDEALGAQAVLRVRLPPLDGRCTSCDRTVTQEEPGWLCPGCGRPTLVFENGDELDLESLVVEDAEPDHD